jgi:hypothetical protein
MIQLEQELGLLYSLGYGETEPESQMEHYPLHGALRLTMAHRAQGAIWDTTERGSGAVG